MSRDTLPIDPVLPEIVSALQAQGRAVLQAPPGAGKTTRVPLALLEAGAEGRIIMLEPRRLAARAAAERLAEALGEKAGGIVGYRMRGDTKVSDATRIEVVTQGILTRMLQSDPELSGIGTVIFDEFHERALDADLGLALAWEVRGALRPDLRLLVMSATLDAGPVAEMMDGAPVVTSEGRSFPVDVRHLDKPLAKGTRFENAVADLVSTAVSETEGGVLVFLPGEGEIRRVEGLLSKRLPKDCALHPLFGALPFAQQRAAVAPAKEGRKVVLATSIAETSLTIEDVRAVVDGGRSRRARFDPGSGMSRLVTERVTRAEAEQRAGRAGRVAPGRAYRLWTKGEEGALAAYPPAEIEAADLTGLALELALWGSEDLAFLTPPPPRALEEARALLADLGALDRHGITEHGRRLAGLPMHPRLGHMLELAGADAAPLAALLSERDPLRGASSDVTQRLNAIRQGHAGEGEANRATLERIRAEAKRLRKQAPEGPGGSPGALAALAYPDRIGLHRGGEHPRYLLSGGKGARFHPSDPLAGQRLVVALDLDGDPTEARIRLAAPVTEGELREITGERIGWVDVCEWSRRDRRVVTRQQERLGALALDDLIWRDPPPEAVAQAMCEGIRELGLRLPNSSERFRTRVELLRDSGAEMPDLSDETLLATLEDWVKPFLNGVRSAEDWKHFDPLPALRAQLTWEQQQEVDRAAPAYFETPLGRAVPVDYAGAHPAISVRLQEMFGVTEHPRVAGEPLQVTLLSPAGRPVQVTTDLPGFWSSSYEDVRKDMRGRYPKHPWPEDPTVADPTLRVKRR